MPESAVHRDVPGAAKGPLGLAAYRLRQTLHALRPHVHEADAERARSLLGPGERALFEAMEKRDRRHGIQVMRLLEAQGVDERDLLAAALLHDCGKGTAPIWLRALNALAGPVVGLVAAESARGWRGAAFRLAHHASLGASLAAAAGASAATIRYISGGAAPGEEAKIALLRSADDRS